MKIQKVAIVVSLLALMAAFVTSCASTTRDCQGHRKMRLSNGVIF